MREGKAEALMKGSLHTDELMGAVVQRDTGLRTARRLSHCFIMDVPTYAETLIVTDAAINIAPTMEDKVDIIQNAIDLAHALHFAEVRVAILSAMETVNPKVPSTVEAGALCKMADRGQITGAILDGPLALDNAINLESVAIKKIDSPVAGRANVLVVPDLEAGNMLAKSLTFLAGADAAGIVLGARVPIILTSRADSVMTRLASCAIAVLVAQARREAGTQDGDLTRWMPIAVLNAGSSSIKFSLFTAAGSELALAARGQAEGLFTSPRFVAKDARGRVLAEKSWGEGVRLGHEGALDHLVAFLRTDFAQHRLVAVGHRVVHGGSPYSKPVRVDAAVRGGAREIRSAGALAPAAQPCADPRAHRAGARRCRRSRASTRHFTTASRRRPGFRVAEGNHRSRCAPLRFPRPVLRVHRADAAAVRRARRGRQNRRAAPRQRRQHVRDRRRAGASRARWASPQSTACRWERAAAASTRA